MSKLVELRDTTIRSRHRFAGRLLVIVRREYLDAAYEYINAAERLLGPGYWDHFESFGEVVVDFLEYVRR